jgi:hypothetical protein
MRKIVLAIAVLGAMTFALAVSAAAPTSFAGSWSLDKAKSQGLSQRLQGADSVTWVITQDAKTISVEKKVAGGQPPAGGGGGGAPAGGPPGGGGGGGGRGAGMGGPASFNVDGSEATSENGPAKITRKATWSSDGKSVELSTNSAFTAPDGTERKNSSTDKLSLSADGKALTSVTHSEGGRGGPQDSTLVFTKQ